MWSEEATGGRILLNAEITATFVRGEVGVR